MRASQYLRLTEDLATPSSCNDKMRARPENSGPVILPRMLQAATFTAGLFLIRLNFPESVRDFTYSFPPVSPSQTGVSTRAPFFRKVASEIYFCPAISGGIAIRVSLRPSRAPLRPLRLKCVLFEPMPPSRRVRPRNCPQAVRCVTSPTCVNGCAIN